jgi:hypothetical protein
VAATLDRCYDSTIHINERLDQLGNTLAMVRKLVTVDKELLAWAAAVRWLKRARALDFASLAWAEYASLSMRLSGGAARDVLGVGHPRA